jgi:hypothetical protein
MPKYLVLTGAVLLLPNVSFAQNLPDHPSSEQCAQIRQAVAQYGYAATKRRALENYGPEAVKFGEQCFTKQPRQARGHDAVSASAVDER